VLYREDDRLWRLSSAVRPEYKDDYDSAQRFCGSARANNSFACD
jgi:hypothetical protein